MKNLILLFFLLPGSAAFAQTASVVGKVADAAGLPLEMSSVALLNPADSTVAYFVVSDREGTFLFRNVPPASYLLHINQFGYGPWQQPLDVKAPSINAGLIVLKPLGTTLAEVNVVAEQSPIVMKKDTIEYNAGAFKTKPDAVVEDLLKKLPGVEVDASGNIKAQGSEIEKIMVDGKEFFSNDPKVVSKNLPADAVKKVQVYDEKTDDEQFTGINDGDQNKTINIVLKEDRKKLWFGNAMAGGGGGSDPRFQSSLKAFNFTPERQLAFLGMANNINQFGFTLQDYLDYNGGIQSFMDGGGRIELDASSFPIDAGQPVYGSILSGVGAMNYTRTKTKGKSFNVTYLGTGQNKDLQENSYSENYLPSSTILSRSNLDEQTGNTTQRASISYRDKSDSLRQFSVNGGFSLGTGKKDRISNSRDTLATGVLLNTFSNGLNNHYLESKGNLSANFNRKMKRNKLMDLFKMNASASGTMQSAMTSWNTQAQFFAVGTETNEEQLLQADEQNGTVNFTTGLIKKLGTGWYLEPNVRIGWRQEEVQRAQDRWAGEYQRVDSVSGSFQTGYRSVIPSVSLKHSSAKTTFQVGTGYEMGTLGTQRASTGAETAYDIQYFTPTMMFSYAFKQTHRLSLSYDAGINTPTADQLNPIPSTVNRMQVVSGNTALKPEYSQTARLNWNLYDNFTFISVFADLQAGYTQNKINLSRTVLPDFSQQVTYVNVPFDYLAGGFVDFSAPIRALKLNVHLKVSEQWNRGISVVNGVDNVNENFMQKYEFSIDNRKKTKWDGSLGVKVNYTTSRFSLQSGLDNNYMEVNYFTSIDWTPTNTWSFEATGNLRSFTSSNQQINTTIPLLSCGVTYFPQQYTRWSFTANIFDILNRNTGIRQQAQMNYFTQTESNILSRYGMLTVTYKIMKAAKVKKSETEVKP